ATEAVKYVYQYGSSIKGDPYRVERFARAARFRTKYCAGDEQVSNTAPYFIGVWDTVGALGAGWFGLGTGAEPEPAGAQGTNGVPHADKIGCGIGYLFVTGAVFRPEAGGAGKALHAIRVALDRAAVLIDVFDRFGS